MQLLTLSEYIDKYAFIANTIEKIMGKSNISVDSISEQDKMYPERYLERRFNIYKEKRQIGFHIWICAIPRRQIANNLLNIFPLKLDKSDSFKQYRHTFYVDFDDFDKLYTVCKLLNNQVKE